MTPDIAKALMQFLARVDLRGAEAPTFMSCIAALEALAAPPPAPPAEAPAAP